MDNYGLIGASLKHSFSKDYFNRKFLEEQISAIYNNYELADIDLLPQLIASNIDLKGLNVTIPYKKEVIRFIDKLDPTAYASQAVNTIRIKRDEKITLEGYNTDSPAFRETLKPLLKGNDIRALILGSGGAANAVSYALKELAIPAVFVSRHNSRNDVINYEAITTDVMKEHLLIVNCTPVGMFPLVNDYPEIPYEHFTSQHIAYDLIYNPKDTLFLQKAKDQGASVKNGLEMLHLQAELAWKIWNAK